jgi:hypothetical protein
MQEVAQEIARHKIDIMALQEIRWQGNGRIDKPEFTIIYSGLDDVESDLKKMEMKGWKEKTRDREKWRLVVEEAKAHSGL